MKIKSFFVFYYFFWQSIVNSFILISAMKNFWASREMRIFFFFKKKLFGSRETRLAGKYSFTLYTSKKEKNKLSKNYNYKIFSSIVSRLERKIISIDFNIIDLLIKLK